MGAAPVEWTEAGPLAGLRVLDLTSGVAGPVAGMLLGDLGSEVVKVHRPGGGPSLSQPGLYMWDRNKVGVELEPSRSGDVDSLDRLVGGADVVLVGTNDDVTGYDALLGRGLGPRSGVWVVMPPYLLDSTPWAGGCESAGLLFSWLGHAWSQASYDDVPVDCVYPLALHMQGIWAATVAVALHLQARASGGEGAVAVVGGAHGGVLVSPGAFAVGRDDPHIHRPGGPGGALPNYRCYRCADGGWLFFGAFTTAFIERGLRAIGAEEILADPRIAGDAARLRLPDNYAWVTAQLESVFVTQPREWWVQLLEKADCPVASVGETADWLDHDQVKAMGLRAEQYKDGHGIVMPGLLVGLSATPGSLRLAATTDPAPITELSHHWLPRGEDAPVVSKAAFRLPLAGARVLDLGTIIAGPYAAGLLGELGAEVVKVERPPAGDEFRTAHGGRGGAGFSVFNRDQRSIMIDLSSEAGAGAFRHMVEASDVVVDNYRPGVTARLGIDHDALATVNPAVITLSINAFGGRGSLGNRPGFDPVVQAMSGIMRSQGGPVEADSPAFLTVPINDVLAAGLGVLGVCAALLTRSRSGLGQHVEATLCASSCLLQSEDLVRVPGRVTTRHGGRDFAGPYPWDRLHRAADGWVRLAARWPDDRSRLADAGFGDDPDQLGAAIAGLGVEDMLGRLNNAGVPAVAARQSRQLIDEKDLLDAGLLCVTDGDRSRVRRVGPGRWLDVPGLDLPPPGEAPQAGEHGREVLAAVGVSQDEIDALVAAGVVLGVRAVAAPDATPTA